ncbi:imidazole glycerol phosphate synthase subunit HisF [Nodosilinea sp. LEGE 06152]|uniref:AglZ/HisF2 family acetamidino modification protein n=1 Tax=Nodosilinea sp. LEGE 06152 TaxID=2777966 RepID=UPI00187F4082|nr:imidazole glycerol phosphate synthase subunit HisF [Nodosilinea sp. LEGE 06152]
MINPRIIPCLLIRRNGLVKTVKFKDPKYIGDIVNTVRIFNEKEVDEIILVDILATVDNQELRLDFLRDIVSECFMPVCYGGGIKRVEQIRQLFEVGVEKISINAAALETPELITEASAVFGAQSIVVSIDIKKNLLGKYSVFSHGGKQDWRRDPVEHAREVEGRGAGEILLHSIDRDGTMAGYDMPIIEKVANAVDIPVIACGGAGSLSDFKQATQAGASALAAGSQFVFHGKHRAVLVTYPSRQEIRDLFTP